MSLCNLCIELIAKKLRYQCFTSRHFRHLTPTTLHMQIWDTLIHFNLVSQTDLTALLPFLIITSGQDGDYFPSFDFGNCIEISVDNFRQLSQVCPTLRELKLTKCKNLTNQILDLILFLFPSLVSLSFRESMQISENGFTSFALRFRDPHHPRPHLRKLHLDKCHALLPQHTLQNIIQDFPQLIELRLSNFKTTMHDAFLIQLSQSCPDLQVFEANKGYSVTDAGVHALLEKCTKLRVLKIGDAGKLSGECFALLAGEESKEEGEEGRVAKALTSPKGKYGKCLQRIELNNVGIPDKYLKIISTACPGLLTLGVAHAPFGIEKTALQNLLRNCTLLKDLAISLTTSECVSWFDLSSSPLSPQPLSNIKSLYLSLLNSVQDSFADQDLQYLVRVCPNLESLVLSGVSDRALDIALKSLGGLTLLELECTHNNTTAKTSQVEDHLPFAAIDLSHLGLTGSSINDEEMKRVLQKLEGRKLSNVRWLRCENLGDEAFEYAAEMFGNQLEQVQLRRTRASAEKCIQALGKWCPNLKVFAFGLPGARKEAASQVSVESVQGLLRRCRKLQVCVVEMTGKPQQIAALKKLYGHVSFVRVNP